MTQGNEPNYSRTTIVGNDGHLADIDVDRSALAILIAI